MLTPDERAEKIVLIGHKDTDALVQHVRKQAAEAIRDAVLEEQQRVIDMLEERRVRVLTDPRDPSWTEHFAELQAAVNWRLQPKAPK
jgi:hypothetical protein